MIRSRILALLSLIVSISAINGQTQTVGLFLSSTAKVASGYALMPPLHNGHTYLIDNNGQVINSWYANDYSPSQMAYFLSNGHLLRSESVPNPGPNAASGVAGAGRGRAAGFPGLDQVNLGPLPQALAGKGACNIVLTVDGMTANTVTVTIQ